MLLNDVSPLPITSVRVGFVITCQIFRLLHQQLTTLFYWHSEDFPTARHWPRGLLGWHDEDINRSALRQLRCANLDPVT